MGGGGGGGGGGAGLYTLSYFWVVARDLFGGSCLEGMK